MDRRVILAGLLTGAGSGIVLAQGSPAPIGGGSAPAVGARLGTYEVEHGKKTALAGAATLETSDVALDKARDPKVKEFARFEHDEQTTIADVLKMIDPSLGRANPDPKMATTIQTLAGMPPGPAYDKAYVAAQIEGHNVLLAIQEDYLKVGKDREHVSIAKLARGMIKEHLAILADLEKALA